MLDKLFVRVRSWLHNDPSGVLGDPAANGGGKINGKSNGKSGEPLMTPPPLPPDAWNEAESGMVITESGIIIIDPSAVEANRQAPPRPASMIVAADDAWALPNLPRAGSPAPVSPSATSPSPSPMSTAATTTTSSNRVGGSDGLNWDEVLARAKARINAVPDPGSATPPKQTRAK